MRAMVARSGRGKCAGVKVVCGVTCCSGTAGLAKVMDRYLFFMVDSPSFSPRIALTSDTK